MLTPIAFLVFNRPETTRLVFEQIRRARPQQLLVVADGPRADHPGEKARCEEVRRIVQTIDWPCDLQLRFREENLGCRRSVAEGLDWLFSKVEQAIILEDDCLPDASFFPFCEELLSRYASDEGVGLISGDNFQNGKNVSPASYYFSRHCHIWGWATWRRAWQKMDLSMSTWPQLRKTNWLEATRGTGPAKHFWKLWFDDAYLGEAGALRTWDVAWTYACWSHEMRCIIPELNLVANIGFGQDSTHTRNGKQRKAFAQGSIKFPLRHPVSKDCFKAADTYTEHTQYYASSLAQRFIHMLRLPISLRSLALLRDGARRLFPKPH